MKIVHVDFSLHSSLMGKIITANGLDNSKHLTAIKKMLPNFIEEELTSRQREIIMLYYYQGLNMCEIARTLNINKSTVSRIIKRAKLKLKKFIKYYI